MEMHGSTRIAASRQTVWEALNDPEMLKSSIPGCETLTKKSDTELAATVALAIGPMKARFSGDVTLSDLDPPNGYTIEGKGSGGALGLAKGGAKVRLTEDGAEATVLSYDVNAQISGKIASLGARMIDSTAKRLAEEFFTSFGRKLQEREAARIAAAAPAPAPVAAPVEPVAAPAPAPAPEEIRVVHRPAAVPVVGDTHTHAAAPAHGAAAAAAHGADAAHGHGHGHGHGADHGHGHGDAHGHGADDVSKLSLPVPLWGWGVGVVVLILLILLLTPA